MKQFLKKLRKNTKRTKRMAQKKPVNPVINSEAVEPELLDLPEYDMSEEFPLSGLALGYVLKKEKFSTVLDIGSGSGKHAEVFERAGKTVTRFDFGKSRAFTDTSKVIIGDFLEHSFDATYDLVWASHVLEHTVHTHGFLQKILATAGENGTVAITVPPAKSQFVGGHVTLWTPALLLYRMVLAGFDCSDAKAFVYGYNISVICSAKRNTLNLDDLAWDFNDIERIKNWLPRDLEVRADGARYGKVYKGSQIFF